MTKYIILDTETTGLNVHRGTAELRDNHCIQIAGVILDESFNEITHFDHLVETSDEQLSQMNEFVTAMHTKNGLIENVKMHGRPKDEIEQKILRNLTVDPFEKVIAIGNNIQFDMEVIRQNFPEVFTRIHHGLIDVSSIRRFIGLIDPFFEEKIYQMKNNDHTALTDCRECLRELKHYMTMIDIEQLGYHNQKRDELNGKIDTGITGNNYLPYKITKEDGTLENRTIVTEVLPSQKDIYKKEIIAPLVYDRHGRRYEIRQEVWYYTEGDCDCKVIVRDINGIPDYEGERCTFIKIKREEEDII